tara:strand:- start:5345 stop:5524 length:180 start_codon:yes stop_codon:yes gene_type:complete
MRSERFRVKLDAVNIEVSVAESHDFPLRSFCGDLKAIGQRSPLDDQRMIASGLERIRKS